MDVNECLQNMEQYKQKLAILIVYCIYTARFDQMKASGDYFVTVIEDTRTNEIIGSATLVIEHKFIHECGSVSSQCQQTDRYNLM